MLEGLLRKRADLSTIFPAVAGPAIGGFAGRAIGARYNAENLGAMLGGITGGVTGQLLKENLETRKVPPGAPYALDTSSAEIPPWALQGAQLLKQSNIGLGVLGGLAGAAGGGLAGNGLGALASLLLPLPDGARSAVRELAPLVGAGIGGVTGAIEGAKAKRQGGLLQRLKGGSEGVKDIILGDTLGPLYPLAEGIKNRDMRGAVRGIAHQGAGVAGGGLLGYGAGKLLDHLAGGPVNVPIANIPLSTLLSGVGATIGGVKGLAHARAPGQGA